MFMRNEIILATVCAMILIGCGDHSLNGIRNSGPPASRAAKPFLVIRQTPQYPLPGERPIWGLVAAVWPDGTVLRPISEATLERPYLRGQLNSAQMSELRRLIEAGNFPGRSTDLVVDAGAIQLSLIEGTTHVQYAESTPLDASRLRRLIDFLFAAKIDGEPSTFDGQVPPEWLE